MPTRSTSKEVQKPAKRGKISIDKIAEKDVEIPADALKKVKGGRSICTGSRCPRLVPIPRRKL